MGERQGDGRLPGRRRVHLGGIASGPRSTAGDAELEARFAAAILRDGVDPEGEQRAVAAFRAARDAGAYQAVRTRRRDDWRPREPWRARLTVKATLSVFLASLALGGVAVAAIGSAVSRDEDAADDMRGAHPSVSVPKRPAPGSSAEASGNASAGSAGASAHPGRPDTAKDILAHCRAYEHVKDRGKAIDATSWRRLVAAAGGEKNVEAYCAAQLGQAAGDGADKGGSGARGSQGGQGNQGDKSGAPVKAGNSGESDKTGSAGSVGEKADTAPKGSSGK
ncbi:hypothetical protein [Streptomyces sp. NPDC046805]|uniref:hypothetical protein n=1 Tax=Streptomyces sp. NPDC046805 TaxID=3155134 RepID=UPI0033F7A30F